MKTINHKDLINVLSNDVKMLVELVAADCIAADCNGSRPLYMGRLFQIELLLIHFGTNDERLFVGEVLNALMVDNFTLAKKLVGINQ